MYWYFAKHNGEFPVPIVLDLPITTDAAFHSSFLETSSVWLTGPPYAPVLKFLSLAQKYISFEI